MKLNKIKFIVFTFMSFMLINCASYDINYKQDEGNWKANLKSYDSEIEHTFYLIGDAGNANMDESLSHLKLLKNELEKE